jgi:hypothetical protein
MSVRFFSKSSIKTGVKSADFWDGSAVVITNSYESIATYTVGSTAQSTITFSSIPSTYKHLQLRASHKSSNPVWATMNLNSDSTTSNYASHRFEGTDNQVIAESFTSSQQNKVFTTYPFFGASVMDFLDYQNTNKYKTVKGLHGWVGDGVGGSNGEVNFMSLIWMNTSAINSISINLSGQTFQQYSHFALYGIRG